MGGAYIEYKRQNLQGGVDTLYVDLGATVQISRSINKKTVITPIVSRPMQDAFPIESGNSQTISVAFKRC